MLSDLWFKSSMIIPRAYLDDPSLNQCLDERVVSVGHKIHINVYIYIYDTSCSMHVTMKHKQLEILQPDDIWFWILWLSWNVSWSHKLVPRQWIIYSYIHDNSQKTTGKLTIIVTWVHMHTDSQRCFTHGTIPEVSSDPQSLPSGQMGKVPILVWGNDESNLHVWNGSVD